MKFSEAYKLAIGEHVEKKGKFSYLSWCYAVKFLREHYPDAVWTVHENEQGLPIFSLADSHMVKVSVEVDGNIYTQWHPILNGANKPIQNPTSFDVNTSIHRALTKAIGIATGIGLALYAGEDLPTDDDGQKFAPDKTTITEAQEIELRDLFTEKYTETVFLKRAGIKRLADLPVARFEKAKDFVKEQSA